MKDSKKRIGICLLVLILLVSTIGVFAESKTVTFGEPMSARAWLNSGDAYTEAMTTPQGPYQEASVRCRSLGEWGNSEWDYGLYSNGSYYAVKDQVSPAVGGESYHVINYSNKYLYCNYN